MVTISVIIIEGKWRALRLLYLQVALEPQAQPRGRLGWLRGKEGRGTLLTSGGAWSTTALHLSA